MHSPHRQLSALLFRLGDRRWTAVIAKSVDASDTRMAGTKTKMRRNLAISASVTSTGSLPNTMAVNECNCEFETAFL